MNWWRKQSIGIKLRRYTGWILYFYAFTHLLNHAMGIFGLQVLEQSREIFVSFWRLPVLEWLVIFCLILHFLLVLARIFRAKTFKGKTGAEWTQVILGLLIPDLMIHHIFETKMAGKFFDTADSYTYYLYWTPDYYPILFILVVAIIWAHGSIGVRLYLQQKSWYRRWGPWLAGIAVGLPVAALFGIFSAEREVERLSTDPAWVSALEQENNPNGVDLLAWHGGWEYEVSFGYLGFIFLFFVTRRVVLYLRRRTKGVAVKYVEGTEVTVTRGTTLLEASLLAGIPHAHICGGRGRCSTCRVHVVNGYR